MTKISSNLSLMYRDLAMADRFAAAERDGYSDVESWWPWADSPTPSLDDIDAFVDGLRSAGLTLRALNFYAGDMSKGIRGVLSHPNETETFRQNVLAVKRIAEATGCRVFNALYGQRIPGLSVEEQDDTAVANLAYAAHELAEFGGIVVLEALTYPDNGEYPLHTLDDAEAIRLRVEVETGENLGLLFDSFHLAGNGVDLFDTIRVHAARIAHVQYADFPGRGAPGTGELDFVSITAALESAGYVGYIGAEFVPGSEPTPLSAVRAVIETAVKA